MKVIIAGSRDFNDYKYLCETMKKLDFSVSEVVSSGARGADLLGERWAKENGIPIKRFDAEWDEYGKAAGFIRNAEMGHYADYLVAFWDGTSPGTADMIRRMRMKRKHGTVMIF